MEQPGTPFVPVAFSNPTLAKRLPLVHEVQNVLARGIPSAVEYVFREALVSPPVRTRRAQQPDLRGSRAILDVPVAAPFEQHEWPLPVWQRRVQQPEQRAGLALLTAPVAPPQVQSSFAMPVVAKPWRQNDGWISQTPINLGVPEPLEFDSTIKYDIVTGLLVKPLSTKIVMSIA
jgi:hypothetical protein